MTEEQGKPSAGECRSHALLDIEDELFKLESALVLLEMAVSNPLLPKEYSAALNLGVEHAMQHAIEMKAQMISARSKSTQGG